MVDEFDTFISITQYTDISISLYTRTAIDLKFGTYPVWWMWTERGNPFDRSQHERGEKNKRTADTTHKYML